MKTNIRCIAILIVIVLSGQSLLLAQDQLRIAVIAKGSTHQFWKLVLTGAKAAAKNYKDVEIVWKAPITENDKAVQVSIVEEVIKDGVSGIVLSPLDDYELAAPVANAMKKKIPVLIFDSKLQGTPGVDYISYVATDNKKGGQLAGEYLAKLLGGKGKVALLRRAAGQKNTTEREEGFLEAIAKHQRIQVLATDQYAGGTALNAWATSMKILKGADGVFCPNESSTSGMLQALRQSKLAGKIKFIGFDFSDALIEALNKKEIDALVAQNPIRMGSISVKTIVDHIRGKKVPSVIDTGVKLVTQENIRDPEIQKLVGKE
jgi:ribose transport system substrate-binding protein